MHAARPRRTATVAAALGLLLVLASGARAQTVSFSPADYVVDETDGTVTVTLVISQAPLGTVGVGYTTMPGTASAGSDYTTRSGFISWPGGDASPKTVTIPIVADVASDSGETFTVNLTVADGAIIGQPSVATVTIVEGGSITARIVIPDGVVENSYGEYVLPVPPGQDTDVVIELSRVPDAPYTVQYRVLPDAAVHDLVFDGVLSRTITLSPPTVAAGSPGTYQRVELVAAPAKTTIGGYLGLSWLDDMSGTAGSGNCFLCDLAGLMFMYGLGPCPADNCDARWSTYCFFFCGANQDFPGCPPARFRDTVSDLAALRQYRDQVLATTPVGQYYATLVSESAAALTNATLHDPLVVYRILQAKDGWIAALSAIAAGAGGGVTITSTMQDDLLAILARLEAAGSPDLANTIATERTRLQLDQIAGLTGEGFQQHIETHGSNVAVETARWGDVKSLFR